jgi:hypothetical protein
LVHRTGDGRRHLRRIERAAHDPPPLIAKQAEEGELGRKNV